MTISGGGGGIAQIRSVVTIPYAATITPAIPARIDLVVNIGTLTGNPTIENPTGSPSDGQTMKLRFTEDGTGNRVPSFGTEYDLNGVVTASLIEAYAATPGATFNIIFEYFSALSAPWVAQALNAGY